jgi:hypothetical protein
MKTSLLTYIRLPFCLKRQSGNFFKTDRSF